MDPFTLDPADLQVDTFPTASSDPTVPAGPMKTWEPGCTTPDLCPIGAVAAA
jgi:hypothetical protein